VLAERKRNCKFGTGNVRAPARAAEEKNIMAKHLNTRRLAILGLVLALGGVLFAQQAPDRKLLVNGKSTNAVVVDVNGHSYLDIETVAQITNGSLKFEPNQVALTIPSANFDTSSPQDNARLSRDFASAALSTLAEMMEWKGTLGTLVKFGLAVDDSWAQMYRERAQVSLDQTSVAVSTDADYDALQLLDTQFANLAKWESVVIAERNDLNGARTVAADSLQNDPVLTKFSKCGRFLSGMLGSGIFADSPSCN
jgi:hypothetical protein